MGKVFDWFMVGGNWEEYQRIQFYKNLPKSVENLSEEEKAKLSRKIKLEK